ncbi:MAG: OAM dimerization domain-containing protein [Bacillota bacterium]
MKVAGDGLVRPYGDTLGDGRMQLSFALPLPAGDQAREVARALLQQLGLEDIQVVATDDAGASFAFIVAYARCRQGVDPSRVRVVRATAPDMTFEEVNAYIARELGRKMVVVGAATGTDAHTVGLDAIMNMKGFAGSYGLERYPEIDAHNLGSQVPNETLVAHLVQLGADAVLVSQVVTQKNVHLPNLTRLIELLEAEGIRDRVVAVCGGPRISHELALELGYDAGFGAGTLPSQVASFLAREVVKRTQKTRTGR